MPQFVPLITAYRTLIGLDGESKDHRAAPQVVENWHMGWLVLSHAHQGIQYSTPGALELSTFFRSAGKPFQALPLLNSSIHKRLTIEEFAVTCASHTGSARHVGLVQQILNKADLNPSALQCGPHAPIDAAEKDRLFLKGLPFDRIHNNCSGKHAGMLLACVRQGFPIEGYLSPQHPLQQQIIDTLKELTGLNTIPTAIDGCGAPVFYLPLSNMASLYALLGTNQVLEPIRNAMIQYPEVVGGEGRIDTVLMQVSQMHLLAKVGADGVMCVSQVGTGYGLALKIADGGELVRNIAIVEILRRLGWLTTEAYHDERLEPFRLEARFNTLGKRVGGYEVHFPPVGLG